MHVQILYLSETGNARSLAEAASSLFSDSSCEMINLAKGQTDEQADAYILVFGIKHNVCPLIVLEQLDRLTGKTLLFMATGAMGGSDAYRVQMECQLLPFLPEACDYRGLFMCPGRLSDKGEAYFAEQMKSLGEDEREERLVNMKAQLESHPNRADLENAVEFVRSRLQLNM